MCDAVTVEVFTLCQQKSVSYKHRDVGVKKVMWYNYKELIFHKQKLRGASQTKTFAEEKKITCMKIHELQINSNAYFLL